MTRQPTGPFQPIGELGGEDYDEAKFLREQVRADLCEIANKRCYEHGAKIVNDILKSYRVTRIRAIKEVPLERER